MAPRGALRGWDRARHFALALLAIHDAGPPDFIQIDPMYTPCVAHQMQMMIVPCTIPQALHDMGLVGCSEPFQGLLAQGMVHGRRFPPGQPHVLGTLHPQDP